MAYMDGQMSASEALDFERSLSEADKQRLADEIRLESALGDCLSGDECCPVALWNSIALRVKNQSPQRNRLRVWQRRFIALAASIAIVTTSALIYRDLVPGSDVIAASSLDIVEDNVSEFARRTEVPGTLEATQQFLNEKGIALRMIDFDAAGCDRHHKVKFLGSCMGSCPKGSIIELRFTCCDRPVKLLVIKKGEGGDRLLRQAARCGKVKVSRELREGVITALVGDIHGHTDLLNLLQPIENDNLV